MDAPAATTAPPIEISTSPHFAAWLARERISLAFTTYQSSKLFLVGINEGGELSVFERTYSRCMGLWASSETLYVSTVYQLWRFENALEPGASYGGYDRLYVPRVAHTTGDLDVHDIGVAADGTIVFVNTLFSCLATVSDTYSFRPLWKPAFVSELAAEDRCHLNGLAMVDGVPRYVTSVARSDVGNGWREARRQGGLLIDVAGDEVVLDGLSMPHSPRWHRGRLWVLDSGNGYLGVVDFKARRLVRASFCPGYARGLAFSGEFAIVGVSRPRHDKTFMDLALDEELARRNEHARCGLLVVDLKTANVAHWLRIEGVVQELYDVAVLSGSKRPMALGFKTEEIDRILRIGPAGPLPRAASAPVAAPAQGSEPAPSPLRP